MHNITDKEIVKRIIKKDERVLLYFYNQHHKGLNRFIYTQIGKKDVAEELTQDVFMDCIERLRSFRGESKLKTYLYTIARHKVIDYYKKKKLKSILFSALPFHFIENIMSVFIDDGIEQRELSGKIERTIHALPNDYQVILRLKYIDGIKVQEIARKLTLSFKATESLLFRARKAFIQSFHHT